MSTMVLALCAILAAAAASQVHTYACACLLSNQWPVVNGDYWWLMIKLLISQYLCVVSILQYYLSSDGIETDPCR